MYAYLYAEHTRCIIHDDCLHIESFCVCMYVRTNVYIHVCMYVCMQNTALHVCMYACMHVRMYVCMYVCIYVCKIQRFMNHGHRPHIESLYVYMHVCMCVRTYVCIHVCMYICMQHRALDESWPSSSYRILVCMYTYIHTYM